MKKMKEIVMKAFMLFLMGTIICGVLYTGVVTAAAQIVFPEKANGSIIEIDGKKYGSELLAQQYTDSTHMWGRVMKIDVSTFTDDKGNKLMYSAPSNLSPASEEYEELIAERVKDIREAHSSMKEKPIPVDLVTGSGSGLDPHISPAAAEYQVERLAQENNMKEKEIRDIIKSATNKKVLGVLGEETVNVLKVNLMIDGILK